MPASRRFFLLERDSEAALLAFWLADLSFLGLGSLIASWLCAFDHQYKQIASWFVTGTISYAAIYGLAFAMMSDYGWSMILTDEMEIDESTGNAAFSNSRVRIEA